MTNTGGSTTPAGWYNDPGGSGHLRWWDGTAWSAHLAPQPTPEPAPVPTPVVPQPAVSLPPVGQAPAVPESAVLTAENQPYVPFQGSWNNRQEPAFGGAASYEYAHPAQSNTVGVWVLAGSGLLSAIAFAIVTSLSWSPFITPYQLGYNIGHSLGLTLGASAVVFLVSVLFAEADRRRLRALGYARVPSLWWMLLAPPTVYLIVRTVLVWGEARRGIAPLIAYFAVNLTSGIALVLLTPILFSGGGAANSSSFASSLQSGLDQKGGHYTVSCPPSIPATVGSRFTCTAVDSAGTSHELTITVVQGANGQPTAKLLSVTPPITN